MQQLCNSFKAVVDRTQTSNHESAFEISLLRMGDERIIGLFQPLLSRYLAQPRNSGLVESHCDGMQVNYYLDEKHQLIAEMRFILLRYGVDAAGHADRRTLKIASSRL